MSPQDEPFRVRIDLDAAQAHEFVHRLAEDDSFREQLSSDPGAALHRYGIEIPPELLGEGIELPSKDVLRALLREVEETGELRWPFLQPLIFPIFLFWFVPPFLRRRGG